MTVFPSLKASWECSTLRPLRSLAVYSCIVNKCHFQISFQWIFKYSFNQQFASQMTTDRNTGFLPAWDWPQTSNSSPDCTIVPTVLYMHIQGYQELVMFACARIYSVSPDHHHHIYCIDHVPPLSFRPWPLVLMSDKNVLGSRPWSKPFLVISLKNMGFELTEKNKSGPLVVITVTN